MLVMPLAVDVRFLCDRANYEECSHLRDFVATVGSAIVTAALEGRTSRSFWNLSIEEQRTLQEQGYKLSRPVNDGSYCVAW